MIIDQATLYLYAGKGGDGCASFSRKGKKTVPDGGDGGKGGSIFLKAESGLYDLSKFKYKRKFRAEDGKRGKPNRRKGKDAPDLFISVPCGTLVRDATGKIIADLKRDKETIRIAEGGRGGRGNASGFEAQQGEEGEEIQVSLDYRIICDVAIVGFANVGKTSLLNALTDKNFKVADYPFTTTSCAWAVVEVEFERFVVLDTPPLKEGGRNDFLKHLLRPQIVIVVVDEPYRAKEDVRKIKDIIGRFDPSYKDKIFFHLLNKIDKIDKSFRLKEFFTVSTREKHTVEILKNKILDTLKRR